MLPNIDISDIEYLRNHISSNVPIFFIAQGLFRHIDKKGYILKNPDFNIKPILPLIDTLIFSDEDIKNPLKTAKIWSSIGPKIIVTVASKGAVLIKNSKLLKFPAFPPNKIIDPIGAGDVFAASFSYAKMNGKGDNYAVMFANAAASFSLSYHSSNLKFSLAQVEKLIDNRG